VIFPNSIVNFPTVPCLLSNGNNNYPGLIDSAKITTHHQSEITPQIPFSSKDELACNAKPASVFLPHICEDCLKEMQKSSISRNGLLASNFFMIAYLIFTSTRKVIFSRSSSFS